MTDVNAAAKTNHETAARMFDQLIANGWVKVPPGWSLVPDMPTAQQLKAVGNVLKRARHPMIFVGDDEGAAALYFAMVQAAPKFADIFPKV